MKRLNNKVAIVTGGASGIGKESVKLFNREGAKVVIADINETSGEDLAKSVNKDGDDAIFIKTDVKESAQVKELIERTVEIFGKLDVMFNNAGIEGQLPAPDTAQVNNIDFDKVIDTNLKGVFYGCKYSISHLLSEGGSIINTSSVAAKVGFPPISPYSAAEGGIVSLTKELAVELAPANIRVNAIASSFIKTPMSGRYTKIAQDPEYFESALLSMHPLGRAGTPEEVAQAALFLASKESSFITGHTLVVDGGFTAR